MNAVILSIGDELVLGQTVDSNSAYLASHLMGLGIQTTYHQTLADDVDLIAKAIKDAAEEAEIVLVTGGLGPTQDDLTRQALADAMGVELKEDWQSLECINRFFSKLGRPMSETNRVQALLPVGTLCIPNSRGTAPGIVALFDRTAVFVMPGVPHEMRAMFEESIWGDLMKDVIGNHAKRIITIKINTFGLGESKVGEMLGDMMARDRNPKVGTTVSAGIVSVRIRSEAENHKQACDQLEHTAKQVESILGPIVIGRDKRTLAEETLKALKEARLTVATAESCTGGLIGKMITDIGGSSQVYAGGWVTYTNEMKHRQLGVPDGLFSEHGAVSGPVVCAMAAGAMERSGADLAVSVSGVAGPTGGTEDKPVGTVWLGLAHRSENNQSEARAVQIRLPGDRSSIRQRASMCALQWLRLHLAGHPPTEMTWVMDSFPKP